MRIYNGTKSSLTLPLMGSNQKINVSPKAISGDFLPNREFLSLIMTTFDYNEIALVVSGPFEISLCSQVSGCVGFVAYSVEEAIERFSPSTKTPAIPSTSNPAVLAEPEIPSGTEEIKADEAPIEEVRYEDEAPVEEAKVEEAEPEKPVRKYRKKKTSSEEE